MKIYEPVDIAVKLRQERVSEKYAKSLEASVDTFLAAYESVSPDLEYSAAAIEQAVEVIRREMSDKRISRDRARKARRLAYDIEDVVDYDNVGDRGLPAWGQRRNPLLRPVSESVRGCRDSVVGLSLAVLDLMREGGYSPHTIQDYEMMFLPKLVWYFLEKGSGEYSDDLIDSYLETTARLRDALGYGPGNTRFSYARAAALHVRNVHRVGSLYEHRTMRDDSVSRVLSGPFGRLAKEYEEWAAGKKRLERSTVEASRPIIARFLEEALELGVQDVSALTKENVREIRGVMTEGKTPKYVSTMITHLRYFAQFVEDEHPECPPLRTWVGKMPKRRKKKPSPGYSDEQAEAILASIDTSTDIGKRDFAILTLAKNTGLRAVDIRSMSLSDIDWRANSIAVVQDKTDQPLVLPLDAETGEAIATYILEVRNAAGDVDTDVLFLSTHSASGKPLSGKAMDDVVKRYAEAALDTGFAGVHSIHSFRRRLGTSMVEAGVPVSDAADVLGHAHTGSMAPYVSIAVESLRICAAGLDDVPTERLRWLK